MPKKTCLFLSFLLFLNGAYAGIQNEQIFKNSLEELNTLNYLAGVNGSINGVVLQRVEKGNDGVLVKAVANNGFVFDQWSDNSTGNPRIDTNIQGDITVTANFIASPFGQDGGHTVAQPYQEPTELATLYYPTDASIANKVPVVFLTPGFGGIEPNQYDTLLRFIASHGFAAVFVEDNNKFDFSSVDMINDISAMVADKAEILDTTRIGVFGHSSGGGYAFNVLDKLSDVQGWGSNGRFLFVSEGWFAFEMMQIDMRTLPSNTNVVMQQYGPGGNSHDNGTDARILLTEFYLLESIAEDKKDFQVDISGDHGSPYGAGATAVDFAEMALILQPLGALMEYTFVDPNNQIAHDAALELGSDDPYADGNGIQVVFPRGDDVNILYPCNGFNFTVEDIDYCDIKGYPYSTQFDYLATNNNTVQPFLGGTASIDLEFGTTITRFTERLLQNDTPTQNANGDRYPRGNHHPYSKTQAWNADMTMIRMNYRIYDANTFEEIPLTTQSGNYPLTTATWSLSDLYNINGALNERKWSAIDPNVFYGVYLSGTNGQLWKGTIDRANNLVTYGGGLIHHFAGDYDKFSLGKFEGNIDFNDQYVALVGRKNGGTFITVIVYDMINNTFVEKDFDGTKGNALVNWTDNPVPQEFDWVSVSPLGSHIIMSTSGNLEQYDMNLNYIGQLSDHATHGDMGIAQNGEEVFVNFQFNAPQGIYAYRLQKFAEGEPANVYHHQLLPEKYNGGHVSCRNYQRPGWCYLSTVAEGHREVTALRINFADMGLNVVNRFAQTHTYTENDGSSMGSLGGVSPDGKRVLFFTDWEESPLDYYDRDTYHVQKLNQ